MAVTFGEQARRMFVPYIVRLTAVPAVRALVFSAWARALPPVAAVVQAARDVRAPASLG